MKTEFTACGVDSQLVIRVGQMAVLQIAKFLETTVHEREVSEWILLTSCFKPNPDTSMQSLALWHSVTALRQGHARNVVLDLFVCFRC